MAVINKREHKTVKKKNKTYSYDYRIGDRRIRLSGKGYQVHGKLTKIAFKNGKYTKAGEALIDTIKNNEDMSDAEKRFYLRELETYKNSAINRESALTMERFSSHLKESKIERMIFNFGSTPQEIADMTGTSTADVLNEDNWNFADNTFLGMWGFEFDYDEYNGFKFTGL